MVVPIEWPFSNWSGVLLKMEWQHPCLPNGMDGGSGSSPNVGTLCFGLKDTRL